MKTLKRILSVFLALLTVFSIASVGVSYAAVTEKMKLSGDFYYTVDKDGTAVIQKVVDKSYAGKTLVIPAKLDGYRVKGMNIVKHVSRPFDALKKSGNADTITSVKIEEGIVQLDALGEMNDPVNSPYIKDPDAKTIAGIFSGLKNLKKVSLPSTLKAVDSGMFSECTSLKSIKIPDKVEFIDQYAFYGCSSLTDINLPDKLEKISDSSFRACTSLKRIKIPKNVKTIETCAFYKCKNLKEVTFPSKLTYIGPQAFANCEKLEKIKLPSELRTIMGLAFKGCKSLTGKLRLPKKLKEVGDGAFAFCTGLTGFKIADGNKYFSQKGGVLFDKKKTHIYCYLSGKETKEYKVPTTVKSVSEYAFAGTKYLKKITLSKNMIEVPECAFYKSKVKTIVLPKSIEEIANSALADCKNLKSLTVKNKSCIMPNHKPFKGSKLTVYGYKNSTAQVFAKEAKLKFVTIK